MRATLIGLLVPHSVFSQARWVSLAQLENSFNERPPMTAVFDIDDTVLFSSYAFAIAEGAFRVKHPEVADPYSDCRFYGAVNDSLDAKYSRPKTIAVALLAFHEARGDTIVFVTKRCASSPANDSTAHYLMRTFHLHRQLTVLFAGSANKVELIRASHPSVSYGDSDTDAEDSRAAAAGLGKIIRFVRVLRNPLSSNTASRQTPGLFGEEVLIDSQY